MLDRAFSIGPKCMEPLEPPKYDFMSSGVGLHLIRYETPIDRMLQRAGHDLERLQARRRDEAVAAPIAVDVTHSVAVGAQADALPVVSGIVTHELSNGNGVSLAASEIPKCRRTATSSRGAHLIASMVCAKPCSCQILHWPARAVSG